MNEFPELDEGGLSKFRASLVSESGLCIQARALELGECLLLGRGEEVTGGREKSSLLSDTFEAVMAAIYLDSREKNGLLEISRVIRKLFLPQLPKMPRAILLGIINLNCRNMFRKLRAYPQHTNLLMKQGRIIKKNLPWRFLLKMRNTVEEVEQVKKLPASLQLKTHL